MSDITAFTHLSILNGGRCTLYIALFVEEEGGANTLRLITELRPHDEAHEIPPDKKLTITVEDDIRSCISPAGNLALRVVAPFHFTQHATHNDDTGETAFTIVPQLD